jgi:predicted DNA-binding protein (UPF0251 family)
MPVSESRIAITTTMVEAPHSLATVKALSPAETEALRRRLAAYVAGFTSESEAAGKIGISQQLVNKIINGGSAGLHAAKRIAAALHMPLEDVIATGGDGIDDLVTRYPRRWSAPAVAATRKMLARSSSGAECDIEALLDRVHAVLAPIDRELLRKR